MMLLSINFTLLAVLFIQKPLEAVQQEVAIQFPQRKESTDPNQSADEHAQNRDFDAFNRRLNSLSTINDFANFLHLEIPEKEPPKPLAVSLRAGGPISLSESPPLADAVSTPIILGQARCIPENVSVPLDLPDEKGVTYFPTCVRVPRCGGCCYVNYHACQPSRTESLQVKVMKVNEQVTLPSRRRRRKRGPDFIVTQVEIHKACECDCRLRSESCDPNLHRHNEFQCACVCKNKEKEFECINSSDHYWNNDKCECICRHEKTCSTGLTFDNKTCNCSRVK